MSESTPFKLDYGAHDDNSPSNDGFENLPEQRRSRSGARLVRISLLVSVIGNVAMAVVCILFVLSSQHPRSLGAGPESGQSNSLVLPGVDEETQMPIRYGWDYYAATVAEMDEVNRNWDNINADAGVVSIPHDELARAGILQAQDDPSDPNKGVLTLSAYHSLHCLKIIRQTMLDLAQGEELKIRFGHAMHCMGSLLRDTVCHADDSMPLGGEGDFQYLRKCRNWDAMRHWVSGRTACMRTRNDGILDMEHQNFANCSRGDGLLFP